MSKPSKVPASYSPREEELRYYIKAPQAGKKSWILISYYLLAADRKKRIYVKPNADLCAKVKKINCRLLSGTIDENQVRTLLGDLIQKQYERYEVQSRAVRDARLSEINEKLFAAYWAERYAPRTKLKDKTSPRLDIKKALSMIGNLSLLTAKKIELENALEKYQTRQADRATSRLNEMLKWLDRKENGVPLRLEAPAPEIREIQYCTLEEFSKILVHIEDVELKLFASVLFGAGLRVGEALALGEHNLRNGVLRIAQQIDKSGKRVLPKKNSVGDVVVVPEFINSVKQWLKVEDKLKLRYKLYDSLYDAARKAFPKSAIGQVDRRWISPCDIRHSHAIYLLENGVSMTQVAQNLRNGIKVCQQYYTGFGNTDGTIDLIKKTLAKAS
ncbi:tyrosine-type recombinase/integrase [Bdellovibrio sp. GT3]|uniref:tyrosine-type recombinase/integrase n=1 Tax=Bdellovibrio sp. GT3 TaxID=3136282 RepID=UPI0030F022D0